ncbi:MAG: cytochrome C oxidase subunit IV family protein [Actinomycetota bacterium]
MSMVEHEDELHDHPEPRKYVFIAVVLAIVTAIEVGLYYLELPGALLVGVLLFFALIKFILVAQWFMHLKFDNRLFKMLFVTGLITAILVFSVVLIIFTDRGGPSPLITG